jgi:hypothetical protein
MPNYCSCHGAGTCNGAVFQFASFFMLDGDPTCDASDFTTGHSQGFAALAFEAGVRTA